MTTHLNEPAPAAARPNVSVPLDFWPSVISSVHADHLPKGSPGHSVMQHGVAALTQIYSAFDDIDKASKAAIAAAPPQLPSPAGDVVARMRQGTPKTGYEAELDRAMLTRFSKIGPALDRSVEAMKRSHAEIESKLAGAFKEDAATREVAGDVRGHFSYKYPKETERFAAVLKVIRGDDAEEALTTARALLSRKAPSFVSGFSKANMKLIRAAAARRFAPDLLDQFERSEKIIAHVENAKTSFVQKFARMRPKQGRERDVDAALGRLAGTK